METLGQLPADTTRKGIHPLYLISLDSTACFPSHVSSKPLSATSIFVIFPSLPALFKEVTNTYFWLLQYFTLQFGEPCFDNILCILQQWRHYKHTPMPSHPHSSDVLHMLQWRTAHTSVTSYICSRDFSYAWVTRSNKSASGEQGFFAWSSGLHIFTDHWHRSVGPLMTLQTELTLLSFCLKGAEIAPEMETDQN